MIPRMKSNAALSMDRTEPNKKCMRSILLPLSETRVTPAERQRDRKKAASEASSFRGVDREIRPAPMAIRNPAIRTGLSLRTEI
jgi:hypothetical protein